MCSLNLRLDEFLSVFELRAAISPCLLRRESADRSVSREVMKMYE